MPAFAAVNPWQWHPHPDVDVIMLSAICGYWWAVHRLGPRLVRPGEAVASRRQQAWFYGGVAVLWAFSEWPVHDISERYLLSVHMVQHAMFSLVAPPMLLLGTPDWLVRWLIRNPVLGFLARQVAKPWSALLLFNFLSVFMHWAPLVNHELRSEPLHFSMHLLLFTGSMCVWLPLINRLPELPRLSAPMKIVYTMGTTITLVAPVTFLAVADKPTYRFYAEAPTVFGISHLSDQQAGAGIMWIFHSIVMLGVIGYFFYDWWRIEQRDPATRSRPERPPAPAAGTAPVVATHAPTTAWNGGGLLVPETLTWADVAEELERR